MFDPVLIIGAGLSGLIAAKELRAHGYKAIVLEEAPAVGGRLATREIGEGRFDSARWDSGAQFFTVREARFAQIVEGWLHDGVSGVWSHGFPGASGRPRNDGHPRYRGIPGMDSIAHYLAAELDVRLYQRVEAVSLVDERWRLALDGGGLIDGRALILTPPLPLSLALLAAGDVHLPDEVQSQLSAIEYAPCLALLVELEESSSIAPPGGLQLHGEPLNFIGDNRLKGVSPRADAVTIHAGPLFSEEYWQTADDEVAELILDEAGYWIGAPVKRWFLDRWLYSIPKDIINRRFLSVPGPAPLIFAGDVFGGPRVEGAALSGLAAAEHLLAGS